jgi:hypothetical protein
MGLLLFWAGGSIGLGLVSQSTTARKADERRVIAFVNVNVIPMDRNRTLKNQTVIVRDGRVAESETPRKSKRRPGRYQSTDAVNTSSPG